MVAQVKLVNYADPTDELIFPITPSELPETADASAKSFNVIGKGSYSFPDGRAEYKLSIAGYFPGKGRWTPFPEKKLENLPHIHDWRHPEELTFQLREWLNNKAKLKYVADSKAGLMQVPVFLSKYSFTKKGPAGDIVYQLDFVEWRSLSVFIDDGGPSGGGSSGGGSDSSQSAGDGDAGEEDANPTTYTVQPGDNLTFISKRFLGDGGRWPEIYDANRDTIGDDPNMISPGMELLIPGGTVAEPNLDGYTPMGTDATVGSDVGDGG